MNVKVVAGSGRWAYWFRPLETVIADEVCQPTAPHFAGQLGQPVHRTPCDAILHTEGYVPDDPKCIWNEND